MKTNLLDPGPNFYKTPDRYVKALAEFNLDGVDPSIPRLLDTAIRRVAQKSTQSGSPVWRQETRENEYLPFSVGTLEFISPYKLGTHRNRRNKPMANDGYGDCHWNAPVYVSFMDIEPEELHKFRLPEYGLEVAQVLADFAMFLYLDRLEDLETDPEWQLLFLSLCDYRNDETHHFVDNFIALTRARYKFERGGDMEEWVKHRMLRANVELGWTKGDHETVYALLRGWQL